MQTCKQSTRHFLMCYSFESITAFCIKIRTENIACSIMTSPPKTNQYTLLVESTLHLSISLHTDSTLYNRTNKFALIMQQLTSFTEFFDSWTGGYFDTFPLEDVAQGAAGAEWERCHDCICMSCFLLTRACLFVPLPNSVCGPLISAAIYLLILPQ